MFTQYATTYMGTHHAVKDAFNCMGPTATTSTPSPSPGETLTKALG